MIDFDQKNFVERLKKAMKSAGGNKAVADKSGVSINTIARYVATKDPALPTVEKLAAIADVCGVSCDYLITGKDASVIIDDAAAETVIKEAIHIAELIAEATNKNGKFDYDPEDFGKTFGQLIRHSLAEKADKDAMTNIINFEMRRGAG